MVQIQTVRVLQIVDCLRHGTGDRRGAFLASRRIGKFPPASVGRRFQPLLKRKPLRLGQRPRMFSGKQLPKFCVERTPDQRHCSGVVVAKTLITKTGVKCVGLIENVFVTAGFAPDCQLLLLGHEKRISLSASQCDPFNISLFPFGESPNTVSYGFVGE